jgi:hypothetical protein
MKAIAKGLVIVVVLALAPVRGWAQAPGKYSPPRTPWGDPDIQGSTIEDPRTWPRSWRVALPFTLHPEYQFFEYACHEGNYAMRNILSAERTAEKQREKDTEKTTAPSSQP